ncbi:hypothetical protein QZH41_006949 [Actinostola sp. cb2023]|nr:hypothetical protein QZH41_006949 [Actinostola sp. cb2023]
MENSNATNSSLEICYYLDKSNAVMIAKVVAYLLILFLSAFGNIFVIVLVLKTRRPRGVMDIFILNMAFSDLSVPLVVVPKMVYEIISDTEGLWSIGGTLGDVLCKICNFVTDISPIVSTLTLCCITIDRFLAVVRPQRFLHKEEKTHYFMSAMTWVIAMAFCSPYLYKFRTTEHDDNKIECEISFDDPEIHRAYLMSACILFVVIPFAMMTCMYTFLFIALRISYKKMVTSLSQKAQRRRVIRMWTIFKLSVAVVIGFAVCWGPWNIGVFLLIFSWGWDSTSTCAFKRYWFFAILFSTSNAAISPWIYLTFVERFKKELRSTIRKSITLLNVITSVQQHRNSSVQTEEN